MKCMELKRICVEAKKENLYPVLDFVNDFLEEKGCPAKDRMILEVCVEEWFVNVAHYAYPGHTGSVEVQVRLKDNMAEITFTDSGIPFDPLKREGPDITLPAEQREIGGLGIYLIKKKADEVSYRYEDQKNIFMFRKKYTSGRDQKTDN